MTLFCNHFIDLLQYKATSGVQSGIDVVLNFIILIVKSDLEYCLRNTFKDGYSWFLKTPNAYFPWPTWPLDMLTWLANISDRRMVLREKKKKSGGGLEGEAAALLPAEP